MIRRLLVLAAAGWRAVPVVHDVPRARLGLRRLCGPADARPVLPALYLLPAGRPMTPDAVLAAVLRLVTPADVPHLEAAVREKVAREIAQRQDSLAWDEMFTVFDAYSDAQDITLGRDGGR